MTDARTEAIEIVERIRLGEAALVGLENIYKAHGLNQDGPASTSAADQCADLYALLSSLGMEVT